MIGIFDSGMGGLTVLKTALDILPNEDFVYLGDSNNAPYGIKSKEKVIELSDNICEMFINKYDVKAIVIACNTATSVAVDILRKKYNIPIIGMEPAIKPAIENNNGGKIVVLATEMTLKEKKFNDLITQYNQNNIITKVPCTKLVEIVENIDFNEIRLNHIIDECLENVDNIESIVLGCTHFI
ncbi:MAG: glutamate racemase, partial [Bacillota bacterium]|nr:glutamate racemase [Bacillota bacterium]